MHNASSFIICCFSAQSIIFFLLLRFRVMASQIKNTFNTENQFSFFFFFFFAEFLTQFKMFLQVFNQFSKPIFWMILSKYVFDPSLTTSSSRLHYDLVLYINGQEKSIMNHHDDSGFSEMLIYSTRRKSNHVSQ